MKMTVIIDGKEVEREVDYVERCERSGRMIQQPVLHNGEYCSRTVSGECYIFKGRLDDESIGE